MLSNLEVRLKRLERIDGKLDILFIIYKLLFQWYNEILRIDLFLQNYSFTDLWIIFLGKSKVDGLEEKLICFILPSLHFILKENGNRLSLLI